MSTEEFIIPNCANPAEFDEWEFTHTWISGLMYVSGADVLSVSRDFPNRRIECERCGSTVSDIRKRTDRSLRVIAAEIRQDWKRPYFGAVPYLDAMSALDKVTDNFFLDSADDIVSYFLSNAGTWRGETARRIKAELKAMTA